MDPEVLNPFFQRGILMMCDLLTHEGRIKFPLPGDVAPWSQDASTEPPETILNDSKDEKINIASHFSFSP